MPCRPQSWAPGTSSANRGEGGIALGARGALTWLSRTRRALRLFAAQLQPGHLRTGQSRHDGGTVQVPAGGYGARLAFRGSAEGSAKRPWGPARAPPPLWTRPPAGLRHRSIPDRPTAPQPAGKGPWFRGGQGRATACASGRCPCALGRPPARTGCPGCGSPEPKGLRRKGRTDRPFGHAGLRFTWRVCAQRARGADSRPRPGSRHPVRAAGRPAHPSP